MAWSKGRTGKLWIGRIKKRKNEAKTCTTIILFKAGQNPNPVLAPRENKFNKYLSTSYQGGSIIFQKGIFPKLNYDQSEIQHQFKSPFILQVLSLDVS